MNKVLIISFYFPPLNISGVYRTLKFVKYLPENGWQPIVLTCKNPGPWPRDESLLNEIRPEIKIYKARHINIRGLLAWLSGIGHAISRRQNARNAPSAVRAQPRKSRFSFFAKIVDSIFIPDQSITWLPSALVKAIRLCMREKINVIYTTSPPHSVHLIGYVISKLRRVRWVADFRDPWLDNVNRLEHIYISPARARLETQLEKAVVTSANCVIANTFINRAVFVKRYSTSVRQKFHVIHNGFDKDDLQRIELDDRPHDKMRLGYAGHVYDGMGENFFTVLRKMLGNGQDWASKIEVNLIGWQGNEFAKQLAQEKELSRILVFGGRLPQRDALQKLMQCDVLLYFGYPSEKAAGWVPSKLFDYFLLCKPILAVVSPGEAMEIIRWAKLGTIVSPYDATNIESALLSFYERFRCHKLTVDPDPELLSRFERKNQARHLAKLFNQIPNDPHVCDCFANEFGSLAIGRSIGRF